MPEAVEKKIRQSVKNAHPDYSKEEEDREVYSIMNIQGMLRHGKKGRRRRHRKEHD